MEQISTYLPVLFLVAAVGIAAVTVFLLGLIVGSRMTRGETPIGSVSVFFKKEPAKKDGISLPKISG